MHLLELLILIIVILHGLKGGVFVIIIVNKKTKEVINNMGTNSAFPYGQMKDELIPHNPETEEIVRLHDNSILAKKIMSTDYKWKFNDDETDIIDIETQSEKDEKELAKQKTLKQKELKELESNIADILFDVIEQNNLEVSAKIKSLIDKRKQLKQEIE